MVKDKQVSESVVIKPLNEVVTPLKIKGIVPYVQLRFSEKAKNQIQATQAAGQQAKSKKNREAKDFDALYEAAMYRFPDGRYGIPAAAFRNAMISACRTVSFKMTLAKLSVFVEADGFDKDDGTPLVALHGKPEKFLKPVRNANGAVDLRMRAQFRDWSATVRVRYDRDQFSSSDIFNLFTRVGRQVGVGEGRPDSRMGGGIGLGLFQVV